ncbi:hypothetical protein ACTA71_002362 [Dictyostelium dimigraforme]
MIENNSLSISINHYSSFKDIKIKKVNLCFDCSYSILIYILIASLQIMEGLGRNEILNWINDLLQLDYKKIEQLGSGAALYQGTYLDKKNLVVLKLFQIFNNKGCPTIVMLPSQLNEYDEEEDLEEMIDGNEDFLKGRFYKN